MRVRVVSGPDLDDFAHRVAALTSAVSINRIGSNDLAWLGREVVAAACAPQTHASRLWVLLSNDGQDLAAIEMEASLGTDGPPDCELWLHPLAGVEEVLPEALAVCREFAAEHARASVLVWYLHREQDASLTSPVGVGSIGRDEMAQALLGSGARLAQVWRVSALEAAHQGSPIEPAEGYRLVHWFGATPPEWRSRVAIMRQVTASDAPTGETGYVAEPFTAEQIAVEEAAAGQAGRELVTVLALAADDSAAGLTQVAVAAGTDLAWQWDTSVAPTHRGRGLGRALKTLCAELVRAGHPEVRRIITVNAAENVHMISINEELGWRPIAHKGVWLMGSGEADPVAGSA